MARRSIICHFEMFPYNYEYYVHLILKENERFNQYHFQARSPQLSFRKELVKSLKELSDKLGLGATTFHLSVHLLDIFMDCHEIDHQQLMLTASTCLLIAAKYVDVDSNVPKFSLLQSLTNHHNSLHEFKTMERMLLNFWKWDLNFSTTLHFLEHYLSCDLFKCAEEMPLHTLNNFKCHTVCLANLTLTEVNFVYFKSSVVASSCIAAARIQFRLTPTWPEELEILTGYSYVDIDECIKHILRFLQIAQSECSYNQILSVGTHEEPSAECKRKLKAIVSSYNCARTKRRNLLQPRDLKRMYCAM